MVAILQETMSIVELCIMKYTLRFDHFEIKIFFGTTWSWSLQWSLLTVLLEYIDPVSYSDTYIQAIKTDRFQETSEIPRPVTGLTVCYVINAEDALFLTATVTG